MKVYFVRHGESEANAKRLHSGWSAAPLTEKGKKDALRAKSFFSTLVPDVVYSSDSLRARQTAAIALPGTEPILTPKVREISVGELAGKSLTECENTYGEFYLERRTRLDYRSFGGECAEDHFSRVVDFLRELESIPGERVAVFCHEGTLRCLYNFIHGLPATERSIRCNNGGVCVFDFTDGVWTIEAWDQP